MIANEKQRMIDASVEWLGSDFNGYWITVNGRTSNMCRFERNLRSLSLWLNDYCYGASFKRGENRLKMVAGVEKHVNGNLHAHIAMTHSNKMHRGFYDINTFVRKRWYKLCDASGSIFGSLVDVQEIGNLESRVQYGLKEIQPRNYEKFNLLYL